MMMMRGFRFGIFIGEYLTFQCHTRSITGEWGKWRRYWGWCLINLVFEFINAAIVVKSVFGKLDFRILLLMFSLSPGIVYVSALQLIKDDRRSFDLHLSAPAPDAIDISMRFLLSFGANPIMKLVTIFCFWNKH